MTIIEFLAARIAEDEAVALTSRDVNYQSQSGVWTFSDGEAEAEADSQRRFGGQSKVAIHASVRGGNFHLDSSGNPRTQNPDMIHIARHDPARILREVAAKRTIVGEYVNENWVEEQGHRTPGTEGGKAARETAVRLIASVYDDHPDFDEEWRP